MTFTDSPDWQEVAVSVPAAGAMPDAPDWQRTTVGPGGTPSGGGGGGGFDSLPPSFYGYKAWSMDPLWTGSRWAGYSGQVRLSALYVPSAITVSKIAVWVQTNGYGGYLSPAQFGIYSQVGAGPTTTPAIALLGVSTQAATLAAMNAPRNVGNYVLEVPLTVPVSLDADTTYMVATMLNTNTNAFFYGPAPGTLGNNNGAPWGYYIEVTQTSLPASVASSGVGANGEIAMVAVG